MKKNILGVEVTDATMNDVLEYSLTHSVNSREKFYMVTPNPEMVVHATRHKPFQRMLNNARISLPDGIGLVLASRILGKPLKEKISGIDFMEQFCKESVRKAVNIGLLGGRENIAELTAECLLRRYPGLRITFVAAEWGEHGFQNAKKYQGAESSYHREEGLASLGKERSSLPQPADPTLPPNHIDMLFVAFGFPKQEEWIVDKLERLPVTAAMGVGGSFDYLSGRVGRAPVFLRKLGLEWFYRLLRQPWRVRRQRALLRFMGLVVKERIIPKVE